MAANDSRAQHARRRKTRRRRAVAAAAGLAVVAGGGTAATAAMTDGAPRWQLETVGLASVTQTVESSGTISAARKSTPSFAVSGTVKSVGVKVGQSVRKGQVLARLDTTSLQADVDSATSTLASAKQKLEADKTGQTSSATGGSVTAAYDGPSSPTERTAADTTTVR
jgi:multidrug efflux pump subunit AcrA (membrane-fusion protein)